MSTFIFIGDASEQYAQQVMDRISDVIADDAKRSLVVWFRQNGQLRYICPCDLDSYTADVSESNRSILRGTLL